MAASPLVSAMIRGGVCLLDEGNRMNEKSWASLAPLLDTRRYVESIVAGVKLKAHPLFRIVATMNDDASTFDLPEYIHSRLQPQILIDFPEREEELAILKENLPFGEEDILQIAQQVKDYLETARREVPDGIELSAPELLFRGGFAIDPNGDQSWDVLPDGRPIVATRRGELAAHPSFFETITATALQTFADHRLGAAVLEVGLGGLFARLELVHDRVHHQGHGKRQDQDQANRGQYRREPRRSPHALVLSHDHCRFRVHRQPGRFGRGRSHPE